jgi:hypothetical protein
MPPSVSRFSNNVGSLTSRSPIGLHGLSVTRIASLCFTLFYFISPSDSDIRHESSLESYWTLLSAGGGDQYCHTRDPVEHITLYFLPYGSLLKACSKMFQTQHNLCCTKYYLDGQIR